MSKLLKSKLNGKTSGKAKVKIASSGCNVTIYADSAGSVDAKSLTIGVGDGFKGAPRFAPFDKILITAAAPEKPKALIDQLKVGGYLVIPYGASEVQEMIRIIKKDQNTLVKEKHGSYRFVPMLKGVNKKS